MHRLHRISSGQPASREALPDVFPALAAAGVRLRKGQVCFIAADPNHGKSILGLVWGLQLAKTHGRRVLVFSADTDESDTLMRAGAHLLDQPQKRIEEMIKSGGGAVTQALAGLKGGVGFSFETDPTYQDLQGELIAHWEMWGEYPDLVIVDNLMDVAGENDDEYGGMRETTRAIKRYARLTGSAFLVLHHTNEDARRKPHPPALSELTGKVGKKPELVLTLHFRDDTNELLVAVVKGRSMKKDRTGESYITMKVDFDRVQFYDSDYNKIGWA